MQGHHVIIMLTGGPVTPRARFDSCMLPRGRHNLIAGVMLLLCEAVATSAAAAAVATAAAYSADAVFADAAAVTSTTSFYPWTVCVSVL